MPERQIVLSRSDCPDLVSRRIRNANWNTCRARIDRQTGDGLLVQPGNRRLTSNKKQPPFRFGLYPDSGGAAMPQSKSDEAGGPPGDFASYLKLASTWR